MFDNSLVLRLLVRTLQSYAMKQVGDEWMQKDYIIDNQMILKLFCVVKVVIGWYQERYWNILLIRSANSLDFLLGTSDTGALYLDW